MSFLDTVLHSNVTEGAAKVGDKTVAVINSVKSA